MLHEIAACSALFAGMMILGGLCCLAFYLLQLCIAGRDEDACLFGFLILSMGIVLMDLADLLVGRFGGEDMLAAIVALVLLRLFFVERATIASLKKARQETARLKELAQGFILLELMRGR